MAFLFYPLDKSSIITGSNNYAIAVKERKFEKNIKKWALHDSFWVRRAALLAHLHHKDQTHKELLAATILQLTHEEEFFIRKAIGWVLRELSKTDPKWVKQFVRSNKTKLSPLSQREALKLHKITKGGTGQKNCPAVS